MKIEIKVDGILKLMPQDQQQRIRRAANMFRENGFTVTIIDNEQKDTNRYN